MATIDNSTVTVTTTIAATLPPESDPNSTITVPSLDPAPAEQSEMWPGWPGDCVFRLIVPMLKVGSIIGRKGELVKKLCEDTRARIRVLDAPVGTPDRVVLISGKEEPDAALSPAMDATLRVFKRVAGLPETEDGENSSGGFCSTRLLVASTQAIYLIGKQGSLIKSIQESTGASVRILQGAELPYYVREDERIVDMQGEPAKVFKALQAVVGQLRRFLVDRSVLPLFEKNYNALVSQERQPETYPEKSVLQLAPQTGISAELPIPPKRDSLFLDNETHSNSNSAPSGLSRYRQDPLLTGSLASGVVRSGAPVVTQVAQIMQIPLTYAEDIIGIGGANIAFIRRTSGAILSVQESRGLLDEIVVEIKGASSQVQMAVQLIQDFISNHKESVTRRYAEIDTESRSSYSHLGGSSYSSSSFPAEPYSGYGSSGGGFGSLRF